MIDGQQREYGEWMIYTFCRENPADAWQPGQPQRFAVRGFAEKRGRSTPTGWVAAERINWLDGLEQHSTDTSADQSRIIDELKKLIDARKALAT